MAVKKNKPTTPGRRRSSSLTYEELTKKKPEKSLLKIIKKKAGRSKGKITVRHKGGGHKRFYRLVDFKRHNFDVPAEVKSIEYDPNRSAFIALLAYEDGKKSYVLSPTGLSVGDKILSSKDKIEIKNGNRMPLEKMPPGSFIYNIEMNPGQGGKIVRSAGLRAALMGVEGKNAQLKMPSGEIRLFDKKSLATLGQVSNADHINVRLGKAGKKRWLGIRPTVRGKAMNPTDHPHGGGEGSTPVGMKHPKTPTGKPAMGKTTRKKNKKSNRMIIKKRRKK
ncbi:MAG: 50S ribosomal protein L2 [Patescibacteria group bacterium]|nr:50S ribosomal protein L2 [Patescibacteria group bacterium]